jgi:hypothetical protein
MVTRALLLVCLASGVARAAAPAADEDPRALAARQACATGQVDRGIRLLADYLTSTDDPTAIYNMARCYQQNGLANQALAQFREYLRKARDLAPDERKQVDDYIRELESQQHAGNGGTLAPASATVVESAPSPAGRPGLRTAGYVLGGVGVVALGAGLASGLSVQAANKDIASENAKPAGQGSARTVKDRMADGARAQTLQWVFIGVGVGSLVAGTVCYVLGMPTRESTALAPWVGPGSAGLSVGGTY